MCCSARPKETPADRALRSTSSSASRFSISRASRWARANRPSRRPRFSSHCGMRSRHSTANRSSRARAAADPHSVEAGIVSPACAAAAPTSAVRFNCGSYRRQMSIAAPGSRHTSTLDGDPMCLLRISSTLAEDPCACEPAPTPTRSGRSMTSRLTQPCAESRRRKVSTFKRCPNAAWQCCERSLSQASAWESGIAADVPRSSRARGWRMPGATMRAAAEVARACSPKSADTSSRRAAMPPRRTQAGKRSKSSATPSTSVIFSNSARTSLSTQA
mmetsp:Transcript_79338/g.204369  ORF Transcript_79338/g.204369 Transcript_79338/m.204369 type:complete len:274 (+) Transcript_79338:1277-2098(+)